MIDRRWMSPHIIIEHIDDDRCGQSPAGHQPYIYP